MLLFVLELLAVLLFDVSLKRLISVSMPFCVLRDLAALMDGGL
jgi:hypothetical protein